jgi:rubredoxin
MNGHLTKVPELKIAEAASAFKKRHPQGWLWDMTHGFEPFWLAPENITELFVIDDSNGTHEIKVSEFFSAQWYGTIAPTPSPAPAPHLHSRPWIWQKPSMARWLVHESDFAVLGTHNKGTEVLGSTISVSDGAGVEDSTGVTYSLLSASSSLYENLMVDSRVSLTWSEKALANGDAPGCWLGTGESPPCVRLTMLGSFTPVPEANKSIALKFLYARHPEMESWSSKGDFVPFWMAPENITEFFLIPFYGGAEHFSVKAYLEAPWYGGGPAPAPVPVTPPSPDSGKLACSACGHVYSAEADGGGKAFEDLPDTWTCPVCGAKKSAFHKISLSDGSSVWTHEESTVVV